MAALPEEEGACALPPNQPPPQGWIPPAVSEPPAGLPKGNYKLVGWDVDTTGTMLVDEICQIAAYISLKKVYTQYVIPSVDGRPPPEPWFITSTGSSVRYRTLQNTVSQKVVRSKSEFSALIEFLDWLESSKAENQKVILIYHDARRQHPSTLIQALKRHNILPRFESIVVGFCDSYALCADRCKGTFKSVSLHMLTKLLLEHGSTCVESAVERSIATYTIVELLANQVLDLDDIDFGHEIGVCEPTPEMIELACQYSRPISTELEAIENMQELNERQNTFRAVFTPVLNCSRQDRRRHIHLRRILAEAGLLCDVLKDAWHEGRRAGLANMLSPLENIITQDDINELVNIFDCHFDPKKEPYRVTFRVPKPEKDESIYVINDSYQSSDSDDADERSSNLSPCGLAAACLAVDEDLYSEM